MALKFVPFTSVPDATFWAELSDRKLNDYRLDESKKTIYGSFTTGNKSDTTPRLLLDAQAFDHSQKESLSNDRFVMLGEIHNANQLETFKNFDKGKLLEMIGKEIWTDIKSGKSMDNPSLLNRFLLISFADVKKYKYFYWFNFPALVLPGEFVQEGKLVPIDDYLDISKKDNLINSLNAIEKSRDKAFFVINNDNGKVDLLCNWKDYVVDRKLVVGVSDCSSAAAPGWPCRNFLALLRVQVSNDVDYVDLVCYRDEWKNGVFDISHSIVLERIKLGTMGESDLQELPKVVGWERNSKNQLGPRQVNLSASRDPKKLAEAATSLNLRLMRWRLLPSLDLEKIAKTKCLLLGSGTLGCNVARNLLGWGVNKITFVDNGKVSFSNPARQTLFEFNDCLDGGKSKALAAADAMKRIFPSIDSEGYELSIPMPGHYVDEKEIDKVKESVDLLVKLIEEHDVVFLLMDSRESRWLPTLLCQHFDKLCMNAALGFDSFLIMRHGSRNAKPEDKLGCYYCSDVVAPADSSKDKTLDQQCTVSRPGLSFLASSMVTELCISVLQHADGKEVAGDLTNTPSKSQDESPLGKIPHQVRGFLSSYQFIIALGKNYDRCTGCSEKVIEAYVKGGFDFLLKVFNENNYLEDITGLTQMKAETEAMDFDIDSCSEDEF